MSKISGLLEVNGRLLYGVVAVVVVLTASLLILGDGGEVEQVDCGQEYDRVVNGSLQPGEISGQCTPVPEDVERQLLTQAMNS